MTSSLPRMLRVEQRFEAPRVVDIPAEVDAQLTKLDLGRTIKAGETVAITAGSRGIANIAIVIKAISDYVRGLGALPIVVPAMGSHGGGSADGQRQIIESYGITEEFTGAEIRSSMETVIVAHTPEGVPVHFDKNTYACDHVIVCGRVKPHTNFAGEIESGLHKMMLIGLGNHEGAKIYHRAIQDSSFQEIVRSVAGVVLERCRVVCGVAIIENAYDETGRIEAVAPQEFYAREVELLKVAKSWMPRLPFPQIDLLIIDAIGKDISGAGMDTNVVGRKYNDHAGTDKDAANCRRIFVRSLTERSHGNAAGIGMAEFTNDRTIAAVDRVATRINVLTGGRPTAAMLPVAFETDREVIEAALSTCGLVEPEQTRVVQISDTLHLREVLVSEIFADALAEREDLTLLGGPFEMAFDGTGNLFPVSAGAATGPA